MTVLAGLHLGDAVLHRLGPAGVRSLDLWLDHALGGSTPSPVLIVGDGAEVAVRKLCWRLRSAGHSAGIIAASAIDYAKIVAAGLPQVLVVVVDTDRELDRRLYLEIASRCGLLLVCDRAMAPPPGAAVLTFQHEPRDPQ